MTLTQEEVSALLDLIASQDDKPFLGQDHPLYEAEAKLQQMEEDEDNDAW